MEGDREHIRLEMESRSSNEEFARVVAAVFMSRLDPTLEEMDDVKTAVSEAVTNAVIHGYREKCGTVVMELTACLLYTSSPLLDGQRTQKIWITSIPQMCW